VVRSLEEQVGRTFPQKIPSKLGVAVSGGSDSVALLHLLVRQLKKNDVRVRAVTVDHKLREGAAAEARDVGALCETLGVAHDVLEWTDWDGKGNLQNEARRARYGLMADWARQNGVQMIALGHTANDQAETVLMRLARRSGVDGLAGMAARHVAHGVDWIRPLLEVERQTLRDYLVAHGVGWAEDPSNDDIGFDRIKARRALIELDALGIDVETLTTVAQNMAEARKALNWQTFLVGREFARVDAGAVVFCARKLRTQPDEIQRRLLVHTINWISGKGYPPRREAVAALLRAITDGSGSTLDGCQVTLHRGQIWIFREYCGVSQTRCRPFELWDDRWRLHSTQPVSAHGGLEVRALGEAGLARISDWRETLRPRALLIGSPSVWQGDDLIAAPAAQPDGTWHAELDGGEEPFFAGLLSH